MFYKLYIQYKVKMGQMILSQSGSTKKNFFLYALENN